MSDSHAAPSAGTPAHLWIVGIVALLWNAMGCFGYVMAETQNEDYMSNYTPEQIEYTYNLPAWYVGFWATAVWFGLLGSLLLLMRKRLAAPVFMISFLAMLVTVIWSLGFGGGLDVLGTSWLYMSIAIFVIALFLVIYSRRMCAAGVLR